MAVEVPTLFHVPTYPSCIPVHALLHLGVPEEEMAVRELTVEQLRTDEELTDLLPNRVVPAVVFPDGTSMYEAGAILLYILETFDTDNTLHPPPGAPNRPLFLQGVFFALTDGFEALAQLVPLVQEVPEEERDQKLIEKAVDNFEDVVVGHLHEVIKPDGRPFYLGDEFSAVDILLSYLFAVFDFTGVGVHDIEDATEYIRRVRGVESHTQVYPDLEPPPEAEVPEGSEMADPDNPPEPKEDDEPADMEDDTRPELNEEEDTITAEEIAAQAAEVAD